MNCCWNYWLFIHLSFQTRCRSNISKAPFSIIFFNSLSEWIYCDEVRSTFPELWLWIQTVSVLSVLSFLEYLFVTNRYSFKIETEIELKGTGEFRLNYFPASYTILKHYAVLSAKHNQVQTLSLETMQENYRSSAWRQENASYWWLYTCWKDAHNFDDLPSKSSQQLIDTTAPCACTEWNCLF